MKITPEIMTTEWADELYRLAEMKPTYGCYGGKGRCGCLIGALKTSLGVRGLMSEADTFAEFRKITGLTSSNIESIEAGFDQGLIGRENNTVTLKKSLVDFDIEGNSKLFDKAFKIGEHMRSVHGQG